MATQQLTPAIESKICRRRGERFVFAVFSATFSAAILCALYGTVRRNKNARGMITTTVIMASVIYTSRQP